MLKRLIFVRLEYSEKYQNFHFEFEDKKMRKPYTNSYFTIEENVKIEMADKFCDYLLHVYNDNEINLRTVQNEWEWFKRFEKYDTIKF